MSWSIFANDGNFQLHLQPGSLPLDEAHFLIASPWGLPGSLPAGLEIVGEAYEISAANTLTTLEKATVLSLRYDPVDAPNPENLAIHRWDFATSTWQNLGGIADTEHRVVSVSVDKLGLYTLLGTSNSALRMEGNLQDSAAAGCVSELIYLPWVTKN